MKNILITGASKGIGFETVKLFLQQDDCRVIAISRNIESLVGLKNTRGTPNRLIPISFDLTNDSHSELVAHLSDFAHVDILINNAGLLINKPFAELSIEDWRTLFEVNVFGPVKLIQYLLPLLQKASKPHIVNIGSMGGFQGSSKFGGLSAYSASKAALANLSECLAGELAGSRIASNCLCLGAVNTEMLQQAFPGYQAPLNSEEMAQFIVEFSSTGHHFLNGQVIPVALNNPGA
ncbi:MAG: SDR family NAD(P)-dependent oxidoreductase [Chitinophagales bacterium]